MKCFAKIVNSYNYFYSISLSRCLLHEIIFLIQIQFLLQSQLFYEKGYARRGGWDCAFLIYLLIYSNKLAYLQLITVLVQGSGPFKSHKQVYLNFQQKPRKIRVNEFIFRTYNLLKINFFIRIFQGFCLKVSENLFQRTLPCLFVVIISRL